MAALQDPLSVDCILGPHSEAALPKSEGIVKRLSFQTCVHSFLVSRVEPPGSHRQHSGSKELLTHCCCHLQQSWGRRLRQSRDGWHSHQSESPPTFLRAASGCWVVCCVVRAVPPGATPAATAHSAEMHTLLPQCVWLCNPGTSRLGWVLGLLFSILPVPQPALPSSPLTCSLCKGCI